MSAISDSVEEIKKDFNAFCGLMLEKSVDIKSIRVFATVKVGNRITMISQGDGDFYSMRGGVYEWMIEHNERLKESIREEGNDAT